MSKTKASILTLVVSIINSLQSVFMSLILNNLIIEIYGSDVNGLISTLNQMVALFAVLEGGFTTAAVVATYEPLVLEDYKRLNDILYSTKKVYIKIAYLIFILSTISGSIYICFLESNFSYTEMFALLLICTLSSAISLGCISKYIVLFQGKNQEYIPVAVGIILRIFTWGISVGFIYLRCHILIVFSVNLLGVIINWLLLLLCGRKSFPYVNYKGKYDPKSITGTKDVVLQKIANTIFTSTDLILISACVSLAYASVYNLYFQVFKSTFTMLASIAQAPFNSFGQFVKEKRTNKELLNYFKLYQHIVLLFSTIILSVTGALIIPFVKVYTAKINDFNYVYPSLAFLFFLQIFSQIINRPFGVLLNVTGNFKLQNMQCALAAVVNIVISVLFIKIWGINSVIFGSFVGTLIILIMNIYQVYKKVLKVTCINVVMHIIINCMMALTIIGISQYIELSVKNYLSLIIYAFLMMVITTIIIISVNYVTAKEETRSVIHFIKERCIKIFVK